MPNLSFLCQQFASSVSQGRDLCPIDKLMMIVNTCVTATVSNDKVEYIDVSLEGDRLACAELCGGAPLLFSHKHGVLALALHALPAAEPLVLPLAWPVPVAALALHCQLASEPHTELCLQIHMRKSDGLTVSVRYVRRKSLAL